MLIRSKTNLVKLKHPLETFLMYLFLSKTKLDETHPNVEFCICGYRIPFRKDKNSRSGSLLLYVNKNTPCKQLTAKTSLADLQIITIELDLRKQKWLINWVISLSESK